MTVTQLRLRVPSMDCPACVSTIQRRLGSMDGVLGVDGSPVARILTVAVDPLRTDPDRVRAALLGIGYDAHAVLAIGVPLGLVSLVAAVVLGDMGVSLAVTLNALRLAR